ncbi:hypothetical protein K2X33_15870, partial [bacterium]|nr:hypothetical protein [bacterium]
ADALRRLPPLSGGAPWVWGGGHARDASGRVIWSQQLSAAQPLPRTWFAYVERHPVFFQGTVRENLVFGNPDRWTDARLWRILEELGAAALVDEFGGLDAALPFKELDRTEMLLLGLARAVLPGRPFIAMEHPGYVGEMEAVREMLRGLTEPPGLIVASVMPPVLSTVERFRQHEASVTASLS